jgi:hypothetical protein
MLNAGNDGTCGTADSEHRGRREIESRVIAKDLQCLTHLPASPYLFLDPAGDGESARFYEVFMQ